MTFIKFEWDAAKNRSNRRKHGVGFEEAGLVFLDPFQISVLERTVGREQRWQTIGAVAGVLLLVVVHTVRIESADPGAEIIRIISARRADRTERRRYEEESD